MSELSPFKLLNIINVVAALSSALILLNCSLLCVADMSSIWFDTTLRFRVADVPCCRCVAAVFVRFLLLLSLMMMF